MSGVSSLTRSHSTHSLSDVWARADDRERALKDAFLESREAIQSDPITYSTLEDPVVDECGHTFNRSTLFQLPIALDGRQQEIPNHVRCPHTRKLVDLTKLRVNYLAKETVDYFAQERIRSCSSSSSSVSSSSGSSSSMPTIADLMIEMRAGREENQKMAKNVEQLKETCTELRKDNEVLKASNQRLETQVQGLQTELQQVKTVNQRLETQVQGLQTELQQVKTNFNQSKTDLEKVKKDLQQVQTEKDGLKTTLKKSEDTAKALHIRCQNLEGRSFLDKLFSLLPCRYDSEIIDTNLTDEQLKLIGEYDPTITTTR